MLRFIDPFEEFDQMVSRLGGLWRGGVMPMDAYESDGMYVLKFDLPGVDPDQVDLTVESNILTVTANRSFEDTEGANWLLRERPVGRYSRRLHLSDRLDTEHVSAGYDQGVLTVTIPVREEMKPRKVQIEAGREAITAGTAA